MKEYVQVGETLNLILGKLIQRVENLEARIAELDTRTNGLKRFGPIESPGFTPPPELPEDVIAEARRILEAREK